MISLKEIMRKVLYETMSFKKLLHSTGTQGAYKTDPTTNRAERGKSHVTARSIRVAAQDDHEAWKFNYKSDKNSSTTGIRYHGVLLFPKTRIGATDYYGKEMPDKGIGGEEDVQDLDCQVHCDCPDYYNRFLYGNAKAGADASGKSVAEPIPANNLGPGLCKHLTALSKFIAHEISMDTPDPKDKPPPKEEPKPVKGPPPSQKPQTSKAPEPEDSYTDSRDDDIFKDYGDDSEEGPLGSSWNLQESKGQLAVRLSQFIKANPTFDVPYE